MDLLREREVDDIVVVGGGVIQEADIPKLKAIGVREVFNAEASTQDLIDGIERILAEYGRDTQTPGRRARDVIAAQTGRVWPPAPDRRAYRPPDDAPYWDRTRETMPADERDAVIRRPGGDGLGLGRAPFYRKHWRPRVSIRATHDRWTTSRACRRSRRPTCARSRQRIRRSALSLRRPAARSIASTARRGRAAGRPRSRGPRRLRTIGEATRGSCGASGFARRHGLLRLDLFALRRIVGHVGRRRAAGRRGVSVRRRRRRR